MKVALALFCVTSSLAGYAQSVHYLDCSASADKGDSLSPQTAWHAVAQANGFIFRPGDSLLLRRGSRCEGMLWPKGSGTENGPIHLGAYGQGALPVVVGDMQPAGLQLHDQEFWEIENLEIMGGSPYGIHIGGSVPILRHFKVTNVVVHDVRGEPVTKDSGLIVVAPDDKTGTRFDDVEIDGARVYRTSEWSGIIVSGAGYATKDNHAQGDRVVVRNSIVHDVAGDGILLARVSHAVLEHNVAWNTGMQETETIGTPDGIWEWMCSDCHVAYNEGFFTDSPGVDGGVFDIDFGNERNVVENNFGHDSQGYCVSVFGAEGVRGNSIGNAVRNNICLHNGRSPRLAKRQGAIFLDTWKGGLLNGVEVAGNTVLWDPPLDVPAFHSDAEFTGMLPNRVTGNTILAVSGSFISSKPGLEFSGNRYCARGQEAGTRGLRKKEPPVSGAVEADKDADAPSELCGCLQELFRKNASYKTQAADTSGSEPATGTPKDTNAAHGHWRLLALVTPEKEQDAMQSRGKLPLIESMMYQFGPLGLDAMIVPSNSITNAEGEQWREDWRISEDISIEASTAEQMRTRYGLSDRLPLALLSPGGDVIGRWPYPVNPADLWLQLERNLGAPSGMQPMPACVHGTLD